MPYHTKKSGTKYQTVSDTGKVIGTHPTKAKSIAQAQAVNISEGYTPLKPKKSKKK